MYMNVLCNVKRAIFISWPRPLSSFCAFNFGSCVWLNLVWCSEKTNIFQNSLQSQAITLILSLECVHNVPAMLHMFEPFNQILIHYSIIWKREFQAFLFSRLFFTLAVLTTTTKIWFVRTCVDIQMVSIKWKLLQYIINRFHPLAPYPLLIP